ncbi:hypothetical protein, partial [Hymenobacter terrestris]|uniref:hypothetical protein n=1 Tax=Hymenobacter terrestris TaxID=2748310 RepID=UPI001C409F5A
NYERLSRTELLGLGIEVKYEERYTRGGPAPEPLSSQQKSIIRGRVFVDKPISNADIEDQQPGIIPRFWGSVNQEGGVHPQNVVEHVERRNNQRDGQRMASLPAFNERAGHGH